MHHFGNGPTWVGDESVEPAVGRRWLGVEFRHLTALAAVAREGSFRRAAERLGYVQSAISGQIAHLEQAVGTQLVERSSGSGTATLTDAGKTLLDHVDEILARFEAARIDVRALAEGPQITIRIGMIEGFGRRRLTPILGAFSEQFPAANVILDESEDHALKFERLRDGELDVIVTELPLPDGPFEHTLLERDEYVLLVPADSPLAVQAEPVTVEDLSNALLILPAGERGADGLAAKLHEYGISETQWVRPHSTAVAQALVGAGLGWAVVASLAVDPDDTSTVAIEVPGLLPERQIVLVKHRERAYPEPVRAIMERIESMSPRPRGAS